MDGEENKPGGRPSLGLRVKAIFFASESLMKQIHEWRQRQDVVPSFSAAVRFLIVRGLEQEGGK